MHDGNFCSPWSRDFDRTRVKRPAGRELDSLGSFWRFGGLSLVTDLEVFPGDREHMTRVKRLSLVRIGSGPTAQSLGRVLPGKQYPRQDLEMPDNQTPVTYPRAVCASDNEEGDEAARRPERSPDQRLSSLSRSYAVPPRASEVLAHLAERAQLGLAAGVQLGGAAV